MDTVQGCVRRVVEGGGGRWALEWRNDAEKEIDKR